MTDRTACTVPLRNLGDVNRFKWTTRLSVVAAMRMERQQSTVARLDTTHIPKGWNIKIVLGVRKNILLMETLLTNA